MLNKAFSDFLESSIRQDFIRYLSLKNSKLSERTKARYISDIDYYIENYIDGDVMVNNYFDFFNKYKIEDYLVNRKSSTSRAALSNLLKFYHNKKRITSDEFLEINEILKSAQKKTQFEYDFINNAVIQGILNNSINYRFPERDQNNKILLPLICALSYNFLFEQDHLMKLKWLDINLEQRKIRNLRSVNDEHVKKWIVIDETTYEIIVRYKNSFYDKPKLTDYFLIINGTKADTNSINGVLGVLKRQENMERIGTTVDLQKLIRSKIYNALVESQGTELINYFHLVGLTKATQLEAALRKYIFELNSKMSSEF